MPEFTNREELKVPRLTAAEKRWIARLEKVLLDCPDRLELVTVGDPCLQVVDADGARESELCDGAAHVDGIVLADIQSACIIHGVS